MAGLSILQDMSLMSLGRQFVGLSKSAFVKLFTGHGGGDGEGRAPPWLGWPPLDLVAPAVTDRCVCDEN